jgi:3-isopropylmalate/(R)-2-methylmalate dehydratase large subunit
MTHDVCGPGTIGVFKREFGKTAKVWDKQRVVIIPDHYIFTADSKSNRNVDILREFVPRAGPSLFLRRHRRPERPVEVRRGEGQC